MRSTRMLITFVAAGIVTVGCAAGGSGSGTAASTASYHGPTASHYVVTEEELASVGDHSAYEALQQLRPTFLRSRDIQTSSNPTPKPVDVYVDGGRADGLDALKRIRAATVKEMRFYEPQEANTKFGTGHNGGLIAVTLK